MNEALTPHTEPIHPLEVYPLAKIALLTFSDSYLPLQRPNLDCTSSSQQSLQKGHFHVRSLCRGVYIGSYHFPVPWRTLGGQTGPRRYHKGTSFNFLQKIICIHPSIVQPVLYTTHVLPQWYLNIPASQHSHSPYRERADSMETAGGAQSQRAYWELARRFHLLQSVRICVRHNKV